MVQSLHLHFAGQQNTIFMDLPLEKRGASTIGRSLILVFALLILPSQLMAQTVRLLEDVPYFDMVINGKPIRIGRIQDTSNKLTGDFAKTSRACPPFCIHPIKAAEGVETFGEIEVLKFLNEEVQNGRGLLVDARIPDWYQKGTIPGSVNLPFTLVSQRDNPYFDRILVALGAKKFGAGWDFSGAQPLCLFCNGPWCDQSPRAINNLIRAGYPAEKLKYYRGGMQMWNLLGLTVETPKG